MHQLFSVIPASAQFPFLIMNCIFSFTLFHKHFRRRNARTATLSRCAVAQWELTTNAVGAASRLSRRSIIIPALSSATSITRPFGNPAMGVSLGAEKEDEEDEEVEEEVEVEEEAKGGPLLQNAPKAAPMISNAARRRPKPELVPMHAPPSWMSLPSPAAAPIRSTLTGSS